MTTATTLSTPQAAWLVAQREIGARLHSRPFLISTAFLILLVVAGVVASVVMAGTAVQGYQVAVTPDAEQYVQQVPGLTTTAVPSREAAEQLLKDGTVQAAVLADPDSRAGLRLLGDTAVPGELVGLLSSAPQVELLNPPPPGPDTSTRYLVSLFFGLMFLMAASMFGSMIAQSVVEEKQTRIVEILLAAIPDRALLAGKVIGNTLLAVAQIVVLALIGLGGLAAVGQTTAILALGTPFVWFTVFFLFGFVLLAALYSAAGALVSRQEDVAATTFPLMLLVMAPYFLVVFLNDNPVALALLSYVPFSAPVAMPSRLYFGEAATWEPLVSLGLLVVTCLGAIWVGARVYSHGLLRMGARVKLGEALRG